MPRDQRPERDDAPVAPPSLERLLKPRSVAIVGVSDTSLPAPNARLTLEGSARVHFVHPRASEVFGLTTYPTLADLPEPVDAVFTAVPGPVAVAQVTEAAAIGAGGLVVVAAGFAEVGGDGVALQRELTAAARAAGLPVIGPNGTGVVNVNLGTSLTILGPFARRRGGLSFVTHSGAMIEAIAAAADRPGGPGLNLLVSAGNEAVTDMADLLDFLVDDDDTRVIGLAIEQIRRPDAFFAAAARALDRGKPVIAITLGRTQRSRRIAASHTTALVGDAWTCRVALRQAGVLLADDIDDLADRASLLERLDRGRWSAANGVAVLTGTGGFAELASDLAPQEGVELPALPDLEPFVQENVPGGSVANPLDVTGFVNAVEGRWERIIDTYASHPEVDALLFLSQHAEWDQQFRALSDAFAAAAERHPAKPFIVSPLAGRAGSWLEDYEHVAIGNALRGSLCALGSMGAFVRTRRDRTVRPASAVPARPAPDGPRIAVPEGTMLGFAASMELIRSAGIAVAEYAVLDEGDPIDAGFDGPYAVKLADVAHRSDLGAVLVGVDADRLPSAVAELRELAARVGRPPAVAIQRMVEGHGEAFIGMRGSELGPVVAFGLGGILVEALGRVGGRVAPFGADDARELIAEFDDTGLLDGHRGAPAWDRDALVTTLLAAGDLAASGRDWIASIDLNPLVITASGPVAVDALCLLA